MTDSYKNDVERIQKLIATIRSDMQKREQKKMVGQSVSMVEGEIRGGITNLDRELDALRQLVDRQTNFKEVMQKEAERRKNQYLELLNAGTQIKQQFDDALQQQKNQLLGNNSKSNGPKYTDNENIRGMNQGQLYQNQKNLEKDQDQKLDRLLDKTGEIKVTGKQIQVTVEEQNRMLDQINKDVEVTTQGMIKTNTKLKKFVAESSNWCLGIFIFLEIVSLILLIIYL